MLKTALARNESCFLRSAMQMDVQGERQEEKLKQRTGIQGEPGPLQRLFFSTPSLFLYHFVFRFHACVAIFFFHLIAPIVPSVAPNSGRSYLRLPGKSLFHHMVSSNHIVTWSKYLQAAEMTLCVPPFITRTDAIGR